LRLAAAHSFLGLVSANWSVSDWRWPSDVMQKRRAQKRLGLPHSLLARENFCLPPLARSLAPTYKAESEQKELPLSTTTLFHPSESEQDGMAGNAVNHFQLLFQSRAIAFAPLISQV
jgi:hypothetical protein